MSRRSNAPIFWLLFGAGGMLAALVGAALVLITGFAAPLGWPLGADFLSYPRMLALSQHWLGKAALFAIVMLFAWHAVHRIKCSLHDIGIHIGVGAKLACYGTALVITLMAAIPLLAVGLRP